MAQAILNPRVGGTGPIGRGGMGVSPGEKPSESRGAWIRRRRIAHARVFIMVARMKRWTIMAALATLWFGTNFIRAADEGALRASKPEVRKEITEVIDAQCAAFRAGDLVKAYGFASADLRAQKPLRIFAEIVRDNYPEIWANMRAEFGLVRDDGTRAVLVVRVFAKESEASYDFTLVKERAGWRIGAVLRHAPTKANKV